MNRTLFVLHILLLVVLITVILLPSLFAGYFFDDFAHLHGALEVRQNFSEGKGNASQLVAADFVVLPEREYTHYRPGGYLLAYLAVLLDASKPWHIYLFSIVTHLIVVLLFYKLASNLLEDKIKGLAAAFIYGTQDIALHGVVWLGAALFYIPSTIFYLLSFLSFLKYLRSKKAIWLVLSAVAFFLTLPFLEAGITLLPVIILYFMLCCVKKPWYKRLIVLLQPRFYLHYAALGFWLFLLSTQNLSARMLSIQVMLKNRLTPEKIVSTLVTFRYYFATTASNELGFAVGGIANNLIVWSTLGLGLILLVALVVALIRINKPFYWFCFLWFAGEIMARYLGATISARGFYIAALPIALIITPAIFRIGSIIAAWSGQKVKEGTVVYLLVAMLICLQIIRLELFIDNWIRITNSIRAEATQLINQLDDFNPYDDVMLLVPTEEQRLMFDTELLPRICVYLNDPTPQFEVVVFDSSRAEELARKKNCHIFVGMPGKFYPYGEELDLAALIPDDLERQYQKYLLSVATSRRREAEALGK